MRRAMGSATACTAWVRRSSSSFASFKPSLVAGILYNLSLFNNTWGSCWAAMRRAMGSATPCTAWLRHSSSSGGSTRYLHRTGPACSQIVLAEYAHKWGPQLQELWQQAACGVATAVHSVMTESPHPNTMLDLQISSGNDKQRAAGVCFFASCCGQQHAGLHLRMQPVHRGKNAAVAQRQE